MSDPQWHAAELNELSHVDFFLDQLARAVERGEVPMASYSALAPRYLARRDELIAVLTRAGLVQPPVPAHAEQPGLASGAEQGALAPEAAELSTVAPGAGAPPLAPPPDAALREPVARREPVSWTTVLLFTGAFLVIAASAVFAFWAWDRVGAGVKLGALAAVTAGFYVAGWYTRTRLGLKVGGSALTVVASAMLLFDWWILIDGFSLPSAAAWSAAMLATSLVYWLSEILLHERFYGVTGAAAQVAWWWLMGSALHISQTWRLAGIAVIALTWALTAERATENETFGSLARMLGYAAPATVVLAGVAFAVNASMLGVSSLPLAESGAVVALCGAAVVTRSSLADKTSRAWIAAALQLPLFTALALPGEASWLAAGLLVALTAAYSVYALLETGMPFAIAAFAAEFLAVQCVLELLDLSDRRRAAVLAGVAVTWVAAAALARFAAQHPGYERIRGAGGLVPVGVWGGTLLLTVSSFAAIFSAGGLPLTGVEILSPDAVLGAVVLCAWAAASLLRRHPAIAAGTVLWSFYAAAALEAWALPGSHSATFAALLVAVAAAWGSVRGAMQRFYSLPEQLVGWTMRAVIVLGVLAGLLAETLHFDTPSTWEGISLVIFVAVVFLLDALFDGPPLCAGVAAVLGVGAAALAGHRPHEFAGRTVLAAGGAAAGLSVAGAALRDVWKERAVWLASAGPVALVALGPGYVESEWAVAGALILWAIATAAAGVASRQEVVAAPTGVLTILAVMSGLSTMNREWPLTVVVVGVICAACGAVAWAPRFGRGEEHSTAGAALAWAGGIGLAWMSVLGLQSRVDYFGEPLASAWVPVTSNGITVSLLLLGAYAVTSAVRWRVDALEYAGWGVVLLAVLVRMHWGDVVGIEPYSTAVAAYVAGMGYLFARRRGMPVPMTTDALATLIAAGIPALLVLSSAGEAAFRHLAWAVGLSTLLVVAGVSLRVRWYFYGGVAATVVAVGWRTIVFLAGVWWVILGVLGVAAIVVALTWERQRLLFSGAQKWTREWR